MKLFPKSKDERVVAEINRIYKIGFFFLTFGILLDVVLQAIGVRLEGTTMGDSSINLLEFGILLAAQLITLLMMNRKGLMDDNAYAEADRYPWKHYLLQGVLVYGDKVFEKHGINRDRTGDREKTRYLCGKQGIFTRDRALIRPGSIRQLETRASTRSASFFHALGGPGRPYNGGGAAGAYRTHNGAKPLKQGHLMAKRGPLGPSRKSQQQTKRTGFAAHGHSIAETAPEGKRASRANGALNRAKINGRGQKQGFGGVDRRRGGVTSCYSRRYGGGGDRAQARQNSPFAKGHFRQSRGDVSLCPYFLGSRGFRAVLGPPKQRDIK